MFHQFCTGVLCYSEHLYDINEDKDYRNEEMYFRDFYERVWGLGLTHIKPEAFWEGFWFWAGEEVESNEEYGLDGVYLGSDQEIDLEEIDGCLAMPPIGVW